MRKTSAQEKSEKTKAEIAATQQMMYDVCKTLEYTDEDIKLSIQHHGGPFDKISDLIEVKYKIESSELSIDHADNDRTQHPLANISEDENNRTLENPGEDNITEPGVMTTGEQQQKFENACLLCERKTGKYVPANRLSLPCGHLTLCESCNTEEVKRCSGSASNHSSRCEKCQGKLSGTMKVYFA